MCVGGGTPVLTEKEPGGVFTAGEDVRHLQSIPALCVVVLQRFCYSVCT